MSSVMPAVQVERLHLFPCLTHGHSSALDQLCATFVDGQPVAILVGERESSASYLIDRFIDNIDRNVATARITKPCRSASVGMQEVIQALGLTPKISGLAGLENALTAFLADQRQQSRRTIICFEDAQDKSSWVLHTVRRLVELETKNRFGLMVVLSGRPGLSELLVKPAFNLIRAHAGPRIVPGPFTLDETRAYVSRAVEAAGFANVGQVFEFDAVTLVHEVCAGVLDSIDDLCCKCIKKENEVGLNPISANHVKKANSRLRKKRISRLAEGRLIARMNGVIVQEHALNHGHTLIGRGNLCDISVDSPVVSRHHALVIDSPAGVGLVDLSSKNGTFVDGRRIKQRVLQNGDLITVGDSTITYFTGDN